MWPLNYVAVSRPTSPVPAIMKCGRFVLRFVTITDNYDLYDLKWTTWTTLDPHSAVVDGARRCLYITEWIGFQDSCIIAHKFVTGTTMNWNVKYNRWRHLATRHSVMVASIEAMCMLWVIFRKGFGRNSVRCKVWLEKTKTSVKSQIGKVAPPGGDPICTPTCWTLCTSLKEIHSGLLEK